jgi:predicted Zn-dependent protease
MKRVLVLFVAGGCLLGQQKAGQGVNFYSVEHEVALGRQLAAGMAATLPVVHDAKLEAYVARVAAPMVAEADPRFHFTFTIFADQKPWWSPGMMMLMPVDGESGEPVSVAGGAIFVPLSTFTKSPNEGVFAFQLAHAIAHITLRHGSRSMTQSELMRIGMEPLNGMPASTGYTKVALAEGARMAVPVAELTFARRFELQADDAAVAMVAMAGYDPQSAVPFLESQLDTHPLLLSAHPPGARRAAAVNGAIARLPEQKYTADTGQFAAMQALAKR